MKKVFALLLAMTLVLGLAACVGTEEKCMSYEEFKDAEVDDKVVIEAYVQATQGWWSDNGKGKITAYLQDKDGGAYFVYEMACEEADAAKLAPGMKIRVDGFKAEWAGEVEIIDATFTFIDEAQWTAEALDVTALLGKDELIDHQNQFVSFKNMSVVKVEYKNGAPGDDIYVTLSPDGENEYSFCVESYLTGPDTEVYKTVGELQVGDKIDVEGFLYWYNGVNPHITSVKKV